MDPKEFDYFFLKSLTLTERLTKENNKIIYILTMYGNLISTLKPGKSNSNGNASEFLDGCNLLF